MFFCPMGMPYTNFFRGLSDPPAPFSDFWLKIHFVPIHRYLHLHTTMPPGDVCARFAARNASLKKETYDSIGPRLDIRLQLFQRPTLNCRRIPEGSAKNPKKREKCDFIKCFNICIFQYIILLHTYKNIVWSFINLFDRYWQTLQKLENSNIYNYFKFRPRMERI